MGREEEWESVIDAGFMGSGSLIIFAGGVGRGSTVVLNVAIL